MFGGNFAPTGWQLCNGELLPIQQNAALFSILGTTFGGNGTTTFAPPDLRGRVPVHMGQGSGLSNYILGEPAGVESVTLQVNQMPAHNHALNGSTTPGSSGSPQNGVPASGLDSQGGSVSGYVPSPNTPLVGVKWTW